MGYKKKYLNYTLKFFFNFNWSQVNDRSCQADSYNHNNNYYHWHLNIMEDINLIYLYQFL
jgi:hypothetical protein